MPQFIALEGTTYSGLAVRPWDMGARARARKDIPPAVDADPCSGWSEPCEHLAECRARSLACRAFVAYANGSAPTVVAKAKRDPSRYLFDKWAGAGSPED